MMEVADIGEQWWRMSVALVVFAGMAIGEWASPKRRQEIPRLFRWSNNIGILAVDALCIRLVFPMAAFGAAVYAQNHSIGLFNVFDLPGTFVFVLSVLLLDLAIYLQHVMFHKVPWLWRLHRMHHADLEFDLTTGIRFHPIEIILSMAIKIILVILLGVPVLAILFFEILLNATAFFNHSNVHLNSTLDKLLRYVLVTPDMHRVHHSIVPRETNSNYGFNVPWWDRLFGTYRAQPEAGHQGMTIGIEQFRTTRDLRLDQMLIQPIKTPHTQTNID